ncbi:Sec-independent protein translocase subunit TatA/TatB [Candidatus Poriferisodalis sp.]
MILLLVFGGAKLPKLARSLGRAQQEFKTGLSEASPGSSAGKDDSADSAS